MLCVAGMFLRDIIQFLQFCTWMWVSRAFAFLVFFFSLSFFFFLRFLFVDVDANTTDQANFALLESVLILLLWSVEIFIGNPLRCLHFLPPGHFCFVFWFWPSFAVTVIVLLNQQMFTLNSLRVLLSEHCWVILFLNVYWKVCVSHTGTMHGQCNHSKNGCKICVSSVCFWQFSHCWGQGSHGQKWYD